MILTCTIFLAYIVLVIQSIICDAFADSFVPIYCFFIICRFPVFKFNIYKSYFIWVLIGMLFDSTANIPFGITTFMLMFADSIQRMFRFNDSIPSAFSNVTWSLFFNFIYISVIYILQIEFITLIDYFIFLFISQIIVLITAQYFFNLNIAVCNFVESKINFSKNTIF